MAFGKIHLLSNLSSATKYQADVWALIESATTRSANILQSRSIPSSIGIFQRKAPPSAFYTKSHAGILSGKYQQPYWRAIVMASSMVHKQKI